MDAPSGYLYIRPDNHQGYKDAVTGFSKNIPEYPFPTWDPDRIITIPIRNITAPANWPKPGKGHNEFDRGGGLDQEDLAEGRRLSHLRLRSASRTTDEPRPRSRGRGWSSG